MAKVWNLQHSKLNKVFPVPSDIDIVKAHKCKPICQLAEEIGLKDYELYGDYKAKVTAKVPKSLENRGKYVIVCGKFEFWPKAKSSANFRRSNFEAMPNPNSVTRRPSRNHSYTAGRGRCLSSNLEPLTDFE